MIQTITRSDLKAIHDIACSSWKSKLEDYAKRNPFGNNIEFSQTEVDEMFKASDSAQIKVLERFFKQPLDIKNKITGFITACEFLGINPNNVYTSYDSKGEIAFKKLKVIIRALNESWWPDWENQNQGKFFNWFTMKGGFSFHGTTVYNTLTDVPSALCLKDRSLAVHASKIAFEEYKDYYTSRD